jgi:hypothetical protein
MAYQGQFAFGYAAQVADFVNKTKARQLAVFKESIQRVINYAQEPVAKGGNMPIKTGFLRASGQMTRDGSIPMSTGAPPANTPLFSFAFDQGPVSLILNSADINDVIIFAYTANYAKFVEARRQFVGLAAQRWVQTVEQVVEELRTKVAA